MLCSNKIPNKEVSNDYNYKIQGKDTEPTINVIEIMEQKLPEYVIKYQSAGYDEIEVLSRKFNQKNNRKRY